MKQRLWLIVATLGCWFWYLPACTSTQVSGDGKELENVRTFHIGLAETRYSGSVPADRIERAREHQIVERIAGLVEQWMIETERWGGADRIRIEVDSFYLPSGGMRWATGPYRGSDHLGAQIYVLRAGQELETFHVEHTIGSSDRSLGENYSANRALENLVEAVAWSVAHTLTPFEERRTIFGVGKREQIERAIDMLEVCGELSYAEFVKYKALGKISVATASSGEARRLKSAFGGSLQRCY